MTARIVGQVNVGACVPTTAALITQLTTELQGKLQGFLNISAALAIKPPGLAAQVEGALALVSQLQGMVAAGLTVSPPGVTLSIAANAAAAAELTAQLGLLAALLVVMGTAGVYVIVDEGDARNFGSEMQAKINDIAPPGNNVHSVTFLATDPAVYEALGKVLLTG